jgi:hypothetical protein
MDTVQAEKVGECQADRACSDNNDLMATFNQCFSGQMMIHLGIPIQSLSMIKTEEVAKTI